MCTRTPTAPVACFIASALISSRWAVRRFAGVGADLPVGPHLIDDDDERGGDVLALDGRGELEDLDARHQRLAFFVFAGVFSAGKSSSLFSASSFAGSSTATVGSTYGVGS